MVLTPVILFVKQKCALGSNKTETFIQNTIYHLQVNVEFFLNVISEVKVQEKPMARMKGKAILCLHIL